MSFLGLDLGEKRIGVAASDETGLIAEARGFIEHRSEAQTFREIQGCVERYRVKTVVLGFPRTLKGEVGKKAKETLEFAERLKAHVACPVVTWDERLTTAQAERGMLEQDMSRMKRRAKRDGIAAEIMLQSYLDFLNHSKKEGGYDHV